MGVRPIMEIFIIFLFLIKASLIKVSKKRKSHNVISQVWFLSNILQSLSVSLLRGPKTQIKQGPENKI